MDEAIILAKKGKKRLMPSAIKRAQSLKPTLAAAIKRAQDKATHTNFINDMHAMERRRGYRLQLAQVNSMLYDNLSPGMRENLGHRRKQLEARIKETLRD